MNNPLIYFGAITGNPTKEEIRAALLRYKQNGAENFIVYPRDGCDVPYMSDAFIEMCGTYIEYAAEIGMNIILYDEYNWPSGTCKGAVQRENEAFCAKYVTKDGEIKINKNYADVLNPLAADSFIRNTHEVYYRHFGKYFGTVIKGIFSDEASFLHSAAEGGSYPYNLTAAERYKSKVGTELIGDIKQGKDVSNVYFKILGELFCEVFVAKVRSWCDKHGIMMTGHLLGEHDTYTSARSNGNVINNLRGFSMPGIDEIFTDTDLDTTQLLTYGCLQAAVRNTDKKGLCELFALGPTDMPLSKLDQMIWLVSLFGVSYYTLAVAPLDIRGNEKKSGYFFPTNYIQPWFCGMNDLTESAKAAALCAEKEIKADVGVLVPFDVSADEYGKNVIAPNMQKLLSLLTKNQYQWILLTDTDCKDGLEIIDVAQKGFSPEEAVAALPKREAYVTDENGGLAQNIIFREYTDGTAVILDMNGQKRSVSYCGKRYELEPREHIVLPQAPYRFEFLSDAADEFDITLQSPNTLRCNFKEDGDEFVFFCEEELSGIKLLVKNYSFDAELYFDKKAVAAKNRTDALPVGVAELYLETEAFTVSKGKHTVKLSKRKKSEPFFPSCFICGSFSASEKDCIRAVEKKVKTGRLDTDTLHQYTGLVKYECEATVPQNSLLRIKCFNQYVKLYIDGEYLGGKFAGYLFDIPNKFYGKKVKLCIEQYSSAGPMLGRAKDVIKDGDGEWWAPINDWFPGKYEALGIEKIEFVKKLQAEIRPAEH